MCDRALVCIPTYNEQESLPGLIARLEEVPVDCLVIDDDSPDGTGALADDLARDHDWLHVLHNGDRSGLGGAYRAGFAWAAQRGYGLIGQMDADGQHPPELWPALVSAIDDAALVVASRYLPGGGSPEWSARRRWMSRAGGRMARAALGIPLTDPTGGFRLWRTELLRRIDVGSTASEGFVFQIETAYRATRVDAQMIEIPYVFAARHAGASKMDGRIIGEGLRVAWRLRRHPWATSAAPPHADPAS